MHAVDCKCKRIVKNAIVYVILEKERKTMKKIDWEKVGAGAIMIFIIIVLGAIYFFMNYIEENYELTNYLWTFNILVLAITPMYYFIHNRKEKRKTKKIEDNIIIKNIDFKYYRDIIDEYSPATLSYILDGIEFDKDLSASVIYLINKGYLKLQEANKITRTNKDCSRLSKDLQILCNSDINHLLAFRKSCETPEEYKRAHMSREAVRRMGKSSKRTGNKRGTCYRKRKI